jgi:MFS family permease
MTSPTWQALITELVPRGEFAAATRLDMVSVNVSRAAGPALAGFLIGGEAEQQRPYHGFVPHVPAGPCCR